MAKIYQNPTRHLEERLDDLLGKMTLAEKLGQLLVLVAPLNALAVDDDGLRSMADFMNTRLASGPAAITGLAAVEPVTPTAYLEMVITLQDYLRNETRLGIPALICERLDDALAAQGVFAAPQPLGLAATFNPPLVQQLAEVQRGALLSLGVRQVLAPSLDVARDPRWRKLETTYGEDPYLVARMGIACIRGLQGDALTTGVLATAGHFLGCALAEGGRKYGAIEVGRRELREVFAEPFAAAIREAGLRSLVCADSAIDGVACISSAGFVEDLLRRDLGFWGMVVAEWYGVERLVSEHRVASGRSEAAALALSAGVDVELPGGECFGAPLEAALERGLVGIELVDRAVRRILRQKFELGLFDVQDAEVAAGTESENLALLEPLCRRLCEQSLVLLKNEAVLPLAQGLRLALLGPGADELTSSAAIASLRREEVSSHPTLRAALAALTQLRYAAGCSADVAAQVDVAAVSQALTGVDLAVVCLDVQAGTANLQLPVAQQQLLRQTIGSGVPTLLVAFGTTVFMLGEFLAAAAAVLVVWRPGAAGGNAIAQVLTGGVNPSGRLPMAVIDHLSQLPAHYNQRVSTSSGLEQLAFAFGHGLSYSKFDYGEPRCAGTVDSHGAVELSFTLENVSSVAGDEVVQLYFHDPVADVTRPRRQLIGFARVTLSPGQIRRVLFQIDVSQFGYYNRQMEYVVDPGQIDLMVGASSADIRGRCQLNVEGERRALKQQQRLATQSHVQDVSQ